MENNNGNVAVLRQRILGAEDKLLDIKSELRDLNLSIKELNAGVMTMGKPKWSIWISAGALLSVVTGAVWGLAIAPLNDRVRMLETATLAFVPREVYTEKWAEAKEERTRMENDIAQRVTKDDLNRLIIDIDRRLPKK